VAFLDESEDGSDADTTWKCESSQQIMEVDESRGENKRKESIPSPIRSSSLPTLPQWVSLG
jgi:hypothetical protein